MKSKQEQKEIEIEIDELLDQMHEMNPQNAEYKKMCDNLSKLLDIRRQSKRKMPVSPDTIALIIANLLGIGLILGFEQAHVITSKAFSLISKLHF